MESEEEYQVGLRKWYACLTCESCRKGRKMDNTSLQNSHELEMEEKNEEPVHDLN